MIEVNTTWELLPNIDQEAYGEWAKETVGKILKAPGLVEFRAHRNILGSPHVQLIATEPKLQISTIKTKYLAPAFFQIL
jgi:hypothetical protein